MTDHWERPDYLRVLGRHLRRIRKAGGYKSKHLSKEFGIPKASVRLIEAGNQAITPKYLVDFCVLMEKELFGLLMEVGNLYRRSRDHRFEVPDDESEDRKMDGVALFLGVPGWCLPCGLISERSISGRTAYSNEK